MGLNRLDFLSNSPKNFIFRNTSNKTNFGGILFLLYIFIVVLIITFYLCYFLTNEDYSVEYTFNQQSLYDEEEELMLNDNRYNPYFDFVFNFYGVDDKGEYYISDDLVHFFLVNGTDKKQKIPLNETLKRRISDIDIILVMDYDSTYDKILKNFVVEIDYNGFILDHQNKSCPLYQATDYRITNSQWFFNNNPEWRIINWRLVKYKADAGFLKLWNKLNKKDEESQKIIGLGFNSINSFFFVDEDDKNIRINGTKYKILGKLDFDINYNIYDEYKRTKKSILDTISNICSLSLTIFNVLSILINFYSQNFNNYKIMENILGNKNTIKIEFKKPDNNIDINNETKKKESLLGNNLCINDEETDKLDEENNQENNDDYNNINEEQNKSRNLPKLTFFDYFFNYIYCEKCCKKRKQKIISKCNEIISKYYSIENIIYNQILLENLFKD